MDYIRDVVAPAVGAAADRLGADGRYDIRIDIDDDGETIRFGYPSAVEDPQAMSGVKSCWNSADATSSIRMSNTRSLPTSPP